MTNSNDDGAPRPQAEVAGDLDGADTLNGRAGASEFSIGGPDGRGGTAAGANPYELLSASLAACTAMTIRLYAEHKKLPLRRVSVDLMHGKVTKPIASTARKAAPEWIASTACSRWRAISTTRRQRSCWRSPTGAPCIARCTRR